MLHAYWYAGRLIVEHELHGATSASYGTQLLKELAEQLMCEFGKGINKLNLGNMQAFYLTYPKWNAVRTELTWAHYRLLLRIVNSSEPQWCQDACI